MVKPRVAVLLAAYNGMCWIEEQLESIQGQQQVDVTIFISVDASTDGTQVWCEQYAALHSNVQVLPSIGRLGGAGKNFFRLFRDVDISSFDFVALADQDDHWYLDKLYRATLHLQNGMHQAYSSNVVAFWPDNRRQLLDKAQPMVAWDYLFEAAGPGCTYVMTAELVEHVQSIVKEHWESVQQVVYHDWFFYAIARSAGFSWYIDPLPSMDYRQHGGNVVGANSGLKSVVKRLGIINSGKWFEQILLTSSLLNDPWPLLKGRPMLNRMAYIQLSLNALKCRRRSRDRLVFAIVCVFLAISGGNGKKAEAALL